LKYRKIDPPTPLKACLPAGSTGRGDNNWLIINKSPLGDLGVRIKKEAFETPSINLIIKKSPSGDLGAKKQ